MESILASLLSGLPSKEHPTVARYLEPHLPLIKSRPLSALYYDLRYERTTYLQHLSPLVQESIQDYRLRILLEQIQRFIVNQKTSQRR